jgi:hypothetical protein
MTESATVLRLKPDGDLGEPVKQQEEPEHLGFLAHQIRVDPSNKWAIVPVRGDEEKVQVDGKQEKIEPAKPGHLVLFAFDGGVRSVTRSTFRATSGLGTSISTRPSLCSTYRWNGGIESSRTSTKTAS